MLELVACEVDAGAEGAAPGEIALAGNAVEIADAVGQEQGVVVAVAGGGVGNVGIALGSRPVDSGWLIMLRPSTQPGAL